MVLFWDVFTCIPMGVLMVALMSVFGFVFKRVFFTFHFQFRFFKTRKTVRFYQPLLQKINIETKFFFWFLINITSGPLSIIISISFDFTNKKCFLNWRSKAIFCCWMWRSQDTPHTTKNQKHWRIYPFLCICKLTYLAIFAIPSWRNFFFFRWIFIISPPRSYTFDNFKLSS